MSPSGVASSKVLVRLKGGYIFGGLVLLRIWAIWGNNPFSSSKFEKLVRLEPHRPQCKRRPWCHLAVMLLYSNGSLDTKQAKRLFALLWKSYAFYYSLLQILVKFVFVLWKEAQWFFLKIFWQVLQTLELQGPNLSQLTFGYIGSNSESLTWFGKMVPTLPKKVHFNNGME